MATWIIITTTNKSNPQRYNKLMNKYGSTKRRMNEWVNEWMEVFVYKKKKEKN